MQAYRAKRAASHREERRAYRTAHLADHAAWERARRARRAVIPHEHYNDLDIAARDYWLCGLCSEPIDGALPRTDPMGLSIDHDTPISQGGPDTPANVHAARLRCSMSRNTRDIFEWLGFAA